MTSKDFQGLIIPFLCNFLCELDETRLILLLISTGWQGDNMAETEMNLGGKGYNLIPKAGKTNLETWSS